MQTPLFKKLKQNGTSFYAFPGAAEDISAQYQNENYRMYFSKYVLLNFPKEQSSVGGTNSQVSYFNFATFSSISPNLPNSFSDRVVESLRNYVANHEITLRESRLNNTEYYYDTRALETTTEKLFWKWCKKLNLVGWEPAVPGDEYFSNSEEFSRTDLTDDSYFPEYLWKEREVKNWDIGSYSQSSGKLELQTQTITNVRVGDVVELVNFNTAGTLPFDVFGSATWSTISLKVSDITNNPLTQTIELDYSTSISSFTETTGFIRIKYHKLVKYIGEVNGVSNVQEANRAYTEVYAHIPDHTGETPDILFRTLPDVNYKPGLEFPIIPSQYQPEIIGAELFSSPIVSNPTNYPGSYYGQFDTIDFIYQCEPGDTLRRSGRFYGVSGDINDPVIDGSGLDGLSVDFNTSHYVKMNITDREVTNFDQFNALQINNQPPTDFEFNAILWYYTVEDLNGNRRTNLYGISFLDNPDNNQTPGEVGIRFPVYQKLVTNGSQDGTSYAFALNLNFNIIHENPQEAYNPEAINSIFSMNLFNEAMRRLSSVNDSFTNILGEQSALKTEILNIKQLLYSQTDLNIINSKISNLENLLQSYSTQQIISSDTIEVELLDTSPSTLRLNNIDARYNRITKFLTSDMYDTTGSLAINVNPPVNKDFLVQIINNDEVDLTLPNNDKLILNISDDLFEKQTMTLLITGSRESTQNKKLDIFINTQNPTVNQSSVTSVLQTETLLIGDINLPVFYNINTNSPNSASTWKGFNFDIDFTSDIKLLSGNFLQLRLDKPDILVTNSVKVGDELVLQNLYVGTTSVFDFSGQYKVATVTGATISLDVSDNIDFVNYASNTYPLNIHTPPTSILSNSPILKLNKGYIITITRISEDVQDSVDLLGQTTFNTNNIALSEKYFIDIKDIDY